MAACGVPLGSADDGPSAFFGRQGESMRGRVGGRPKKGPPPEVGGGVKIFVRAINDLFQASKGN
jgi:hypothetical protein